MWSVWGVRISLQCIVSQWSNCGSGRLERFYCMRIGRDWYIGGGRLERFYFIYMWALLGTGRAVEVVS